jgi:hypothetical protein
MRMAIRLYTRLTNAFSKKVENRAYMVAQYALWYNFVPVHKAFASVQRWPRGSKRGCGQWSIVALIDERAEHNPPQLADRLVA